MTATNDRQSQRANEPQGAHLVGSIPLRDAEEVFTVASKTLGDRLRRIPDGETGERSNFIGWQARVFAAHPAFESTAPPAGPEEAAGLPQFAPVAGTDPTSLSFDNLGYADAAIASYEEFDRLKEAGVVPDRMRFQVCLPTPATVTLVFVRPDARGDVEPAYEAAMLSELDRIVAAVPGHELAIQVDAACEIGVWEGVFPLEGGREGAIERFRRLTERVPDGVELGFHLCYGDAGHEHFMQPKDAGMLVDLAAAIFDGIGRDLQWIHMPVPRDRYDPEYFAPLTRLQLPATTELYLGLVHHTDGMKGTNRRIETAREVVPVFGVATECGFGRRPPETVEDLLRIHAQVSAPAAAGGSSFRVR